MTYAKSIPLSISVNAKMLALIETFGNMKGCSKPEEAVLKALETFFSGSEVRIVTNPLNQAA